MSIDSEYDSQSMLESLLQNSKEQTDISSWSRMLRKCEMIQSEPISKKLFLNSSSFLDQRQHQMLSYMRSWMHSQISWWHRLVKGWHFHEGSQSIQSKRLDRAVFSVMSKRIHILLHNTKLCINTDTPQPLAYRVSKDHFFYIMTPMKCAGGVLLHTILFLFILKLWLY